MTKVPCVYILTNLRRTTFYVGVTSDPIKRVYQHKTKQTKGFTSKYNLDQLVYYEILDTMEGAIAREKQIKGKSRQYKIALIESVNIEYRDLSDELVG